MNYGCAAHLFLTYVGGPVHVRPSFHIAFPHTPTPRTQMAGPSMMPTMSAAGEICIESTLAHRLRADAPARGALVTFTSPLDPGRLVCKRVLGLPGDVVCVDPLGARAPSAQHVVVPRGHLWLVGDNAAASRDSRTYGPVSMALVRGRLVARVSPPARALCHSSRGG